MSRPPKSPSIFPQITNINTYLAFKPLPILENRLQIRNLSSDTPTTVSMNSDH